MITKGDVFKEIISPKEVEKLEEPKTFLLIYKAVYMCLRVILDVRQNQVRMSNGEKLQLKTRPASETKFDNQKQDVVRDKGNEVIKSTDTVVFDKSKE